MSKNLGKLKVDKDDFDLKKIVGRFLDQWKLYAILVPVMLLLGFLFIKYVTPKYTIHAKVLIQDQQGNSSSTSSFMPSSMLSGFSDLLDMPSSVNDELAILQTRDLLSKVVTDLQLNVNYYRKETVTDVQVYKTSPFTAAFTPLSDSTQDTFFELNFTDTIGFKKFNISCSDLSFNADAQFDKPIITPIGSFVIKHTGQSFQGENKYLLEVNSADATVDIITKNITTAIPDDKTDLITLDYITNIPAQGEDILKTLIYEYITRNLSEKNRMSDSAISFINSRILLVASDLRGIETDIQEFKQANNIADIEEQSKSLVDNTSVYYDKLNEAEVQLNVIQTMLTYLKNENNNNRPVPSLLTTDPTFLDLINKYNTLLVQKDRILLTVKENNPIVGNLNTQIYNLRNDLVKSLTSQLNAAQITRNNLQQQSNQISGLIHKAPAQEKEYIDLSRERDVKQALYLYLLQKKEETAITKASNISSANVIQIPKSEYLPYFPNKLLIMCGAFILGFMIPTGIIISKMTLGSRIITREDITDNTDVSILGEIGHSDVEAVLLDKQSRSVIAEQFRVLRTNMDFTTRGVTCPKILITSGISGEGKSFISSNLAQVYALSGKKVLLMELDLRRPKLSSALGIKNDTGFSSFMMHKKSIFEYIKQVQTTSVYLLGSGPIPPNPAELLMDDSIKTMFETLEKEFDVIIMDAPPIGAVTDAQILSVFSNVNLFVVRQRYSYKNTLDIVNDITENKKFKNLYLVVNDVKKGASYKYGYGYGYGYGYKYD